MDQDPKYNERMLNAEIQQLKEHLELERNTAQALNEQLERIRTPVEGPSRFEQLWVEAAMS